MPEHRFNHLNTQGTATEMSFIYKERPQHTPLRFGQINHWQSYKTAQLASSWDFILETQHSYIQTRDHQTCSGLTHLSGPGCSFFHMHALMKCVCMLRHPRMKSLGNVCKERQGWGAEGLLGLRWRKYGKQAKWRTYPQKMDFLKRHF